MKYGRPLPDYDATQPSEMLISAAVRSLWSRLAIGAGSTPGILRAKQVLWYASVLAYGPSLYLIAQCFTAEVLSAQCYAGVPPHVLQVDLYFVILLGSALLLFVLRFSEASARFLANAFALLLFAILKSLIR